LHRFHDSRPRGAVPLASPRLAAAVALWCTGAAAAPRARRNPCPVPAPLLLADARPIRTASRSRATAPEVSAAGDALLSGKVGAPGRSHLTAEDARYDAAASSRSTWAAPSNTATPSCAGSGERHLEYTAGATFGGAEFELPSRPARGPPEGSR
jgi:hypothetical protein